MDIYDIIALSTGLVSVFLGIFAVILALHQKKEADKVNEKTLELLIDVKTDANIVSKIAIPELKEYGKSMRKLIFRENHEGDLLELDNIGEKIEISVAKSMSDFNNQIETIKGEIDSKFVQGNNSEELKKILEQLDNLRSVIDKSGKALQKDIKEITEDVEVDLSSLQIPSLKVYHGYFDTLSSFLNMLYLDYLQQKVPIWSYGKRWGLRNKRSGNIIEKNGRTDIRSLKDAGIYPGDSLEFVKL